MRRCQAGRTVQDASHKRERRFRLGPLPDSDLIGIPLAVGVSLAVLAILATFIFIGWPGMIVLGIVLVAALAISYRVVMDAEQRR
jgi:hypothetical protein